MFQVMGRNLCEVALWSEQSSKTTKFAINLIANITKNSKDIKIHLQWDKITLLNWVYNSNSSTGSDAFISRLWFDTVE